MCGLTISIKTIKAKRHAERWHFELSRVTPGLDVASAGTVRRRTGKSSMYEGKLWDREVFVSLCSCEQWNMSAVIVWRAVTMKYMISFSVRCRLLSVEIKRK